MHEKLQSYRRFLDPNVISKLSRLDLVARLVVEGFITGLHKSPYHGFSVEFAEHRQYMPGDEIKHIDWKVYAKTDRFYVKEYEEETNLKAYILLDTSGSMGYYSTGIDKLQYSTYLASALTFLMLKQRDSVGLVIFDEKIRKYIPPRSVPTHLHVILQELTRIKAAEGTDVSVTFHELAEKIKRRGLVIIISDLFDEPLRILSGLKHFRHKKHEVIVFHVLDKYEIDFPFQEETIFRDLESNQQIHTQPWQLRKEYRLNIRGLIDRYKRECRHSLIDYVQLTTATSYDQALFSYLSKRKRLG